jgi:hypothetical protein
MDPASPERALDEVEHDEYEETDDARSEGHQSNRTINRIFHGGGGGKPMDKVGLSKPGPMIRNFWTDSKFLDPPFIISGL